MYDTELSYHLKQVKALELRLASEQKAVDRLRAEMDEACSQLQCKLSASYHEVCCATCYVLVHKQTYWPQRVNPGFVTGILPSLVCTGRATSRSFGMPI